MEPRLTNPYSHAMYEYCRAKPRSLEDHPWGEIVFKVDGRVFAFLGAGDRGGVTVKAREEDVDVLLQHEAIKRARYVGRYGWVSVTAEDDERLELAFGLIDDSYDLIAARGPRARG